MRTDYRNAPCKLSPEAAAKFHPEAGETRRGLRQGDLQETWRLHVAGALSAEEKDARVQESRAAAMQEADAADQANQRPHGGDRSKVDNKNDDINLAQPKGTSTAYALRRLRKHAPAIHARVQESRAAAMQEADAATPDLKPVGRPEKGSAHTSDATIVGRGTAYALSRLRKDRHPRPSGPPAGFLGPPEEAPAPRVKSARSANRAKAWRADRTRAAAYLMAKARSEEERAAVERAYEEEMAAGPDFINYRSRSVFQAAEKVGLDRNAFLRIMRAIEAIERGVYRTGRRKGAQGVGRAVPKVLKVLLNLTLKFGRQVFPTLVNIADWACACKDAVVDAIKFLELYGFITKQRRIKRIQTPLGPKVVQDSNLYTVHEPRGLGAIAQQIFGKRSESGTPPPSAKQGFISSLVAAFGGERTGRNGREGDMREGTGAIGGALNEKR